MEYSKITTLTGRLVSINGTNQEKVLNNYLNYLNGGGSTVLET